MSDEKNFASAMKRLNFYMKQKRLLATKNYKRNKARLKYIDKKIEYWREESTAIKSELNSKKIDSDTETS